MPKNIKRGYILGDAVPVHIQHFGMYSGDRYVLESREFGVQLTLNASQRFAYYVGRAMRENMSTPCVVDTYDEIRQNCDLLVPPGISRDSRLFVSGLAVPQLAVHSMLGGAGDPKGFLLESPYLGPQLFFVYPEYVRHPGADYKGIIKMVYRDDTKRRPKVCVIMNSVDDPEVFEQNKEALRRLESSSTRKWWEQHAKQGCVNLKHDDNQRSVICLPDISHSC